VAAILAAVFWPRLKHDNATSPATTSDVVQPTNKPTSNGNNYSNSTYLASTTSPVPTSKLIEANDMKTPEGFKKYVEKQNMPIEFYGKVIDQDSNPVPDAKVDIGIRHWTMPDPAVLLAGGDTIHLDQTSDANGCFEFHGATGDGFGIGITKDGYELEPDRYGFGPIAGSYDNPVVFKMWSTNIHEALISGQRSFHIVPDGRPYFINFTDGAIAESGGGDLKVWVKRPEQITYGQRYDWSCEVDVTNGGLQAASDYSMYLAPTDGYVPSFQFEQTVGSGWGDSTGERRFYVMLNNGKEYGRITIELYAYYNNQIPGMIRLSYAINPSGSRILR
jgi:hypothetical protein